MGLFAMNDLGPLLALMREVTGPEVSDGKLTVLVTLVVSFMGRKGGRPRAHQIDVAKPVTPETQTGLQTSTNGGLGGSSLVLSSPDSPEPSKPNLRRKYNSMSLPAGFADFWDLYPRRVCKVAAITAWERINPDINLRTSIVMAIKWQAENVFARRETEKVPHPATWLNGRRWEDERPKTASAPVAKVTSPLAAYCDWHREPINAGKPTRFPKETCPDCKHLKAANRPRTESDTQIALGGNGR